MSELIKTYSEQLSNNSTETLLAAWQQWTGQTDWVGGPETENDFRNWRDHKASLECAIRVRVFAHLPAFTATV